MARRIVLGRDELIHLISRSDFYQLTGNVFQEVGQLAMAAVPAFQESAKRRCCGGDPAILFPAVDRLMLELRGSDAAKEAFRVFLAANKGYAIGTIALYYRKGREPHPDRLEF